MQFLTSLLGESAGMIVTSVLALGIVLVLVVLGLWLLKLVTRIIVLDNGRIAADGERDAVLAQLKVSVGDSS